MIKAIIFDWAGVIASDGYWIWLGKNIKDIEEKRSYFQDISEKVDSARISHNEFEEILTSISDKLEQDVWQEVKLEIIINKELLEVIKTLKNRYKIGLLSNFTFPWLNELLSENNLYRLFDACIISSEHKVIKPQKEAFEKVLNALNVSANESVFIDDRQINVDAANKLTLNGLLFKDNARLLNDLRLLGVEV